MLFTTLYPSPVGILKLVGDGESLAGLEILPPTECGGSCAAEKYENNMLFAETRRWLDRYFSGGRPELSELNVSLAPQGGEFRQSVWKLLCNIPYGQLTTYGILAKEIAAIRGMERMSAQAVGNAVGHNPIGIIIPCHRVIGANGSLTGYAGGLNAKQALLEIEGHDISDNRVSGYSVKEEHQCR